MNRAIAEITQARLQTLRDKLTYNSMPVYTSNFIAENRHLLNEIAKAIMQEYHISAFSGFRLAMEDGVKLFLAAEKILSNTETAISHGRQLNEILIIVKEALKEDGPCEAGSYFMAKRAGEPYLGYIGA